MKALFPIAWVTVRELIFERVFYLLIGFALLSFSFSFLLSQLTYVEQSKILLDFMLAAIHVTSILFSVFMAISLLHREVTVGSIYMVLSKPISRPTYLIGKYLGQIIVQSGVIFTMGLLTIFVCAILKNTNYSMLSLAQSLLFMAMEAAILTAMTYVFAVNSGAIISAALSLTLFGAGHARTIIDNNIGDSSSTSIWIFVKGLLPNLELFNHKNFASYGVTVGVPELGWALLYATCCVTFFLVIATLTFSNRDVRA